MLNVVRHFKGQWKVGKENVTRAMSISMGAYLYPSTEMERSLATASLVGRSVTADGALCWCYQ